jgi:P pilus assembly chaperone PapD
MRAPIDVETRAGGAERMARRRESLARLFVRGGGGEQMVDMVVEFAMRKVCEVYVRPNASSNAFFSPRPSIVRRTLPE